MFAHGDCWSSGEDRKAGQFWRKPTESHPKVQIWQLCLGIRVEYAKSHVSGSSSTALDERTYVRVPTHTLATHTHTTHLHHALEFWRSSKLMHAAGLHRSAANECQALICRSKACKMSPVTALLCISLLVFLDYLVRSTVLFWQVGYITCTLATRTRI